MNKLHFVRRVVSLGISLALMAWAVPANGAADESTPRFDFLTIKGKTYTNVTVTSREAAYIIIVHAGGIESVKLADIPSDVRWKLGYRTGPAKTNTGVSFGLEQLSHLPWRAAEKAGSNSPAVQAGTNGSALVKWEPAVIQRLRQQYLPKPAEIDRTGLIVAVAAAAGLYLFFCYGCHLICLKAGKPAGPLVWLPLLKMIPLLRAANLSAWWFLLWLVPVLNVVVWVIWSICIVRALGRSVVFTLLLLLPLLNALAFFYLAFAKAQSGSPARAKSG